MRRGFYQQARQLIHPGELVDAHETVPSQLVAVPSHLVTKTRGRAQKRSNCCAAVFLKVPVSPVFNPCSGAQRVQPEFVVVLLCSPVSPALYSISSVLFRTMGVLDTVAPFAV
jgi:hypothetical protein